MNNRQMMMKLNRELARQGYQELAKVMDDILVSCPRYAVQVGSSKEFVADVVKILDGLSYNDLNVFVTNSEEENHARKIVAQAIKIKSSLVFFDDTLFVAIDSFST